MARKKIRVAIAGQGRSGYAIHANWLRQAPGKYTIVAVASERKPQLKKAAGEFGCRTYETYQEMLKAGDFDLLINATPSHLHVKATLAGLKAGFHVVGEKPVAGKVSEIDRIIAAARASRKVFAPFQNSRFWPYFTKTQQIIESGVLGSILHARLDWSGFARRWDWQTLQEFGGGNLNNTGPHPMDQAIMLFGNRLPKIFARLVSGPNTTGDADDLAMVTLYGKGSPTVEVVISSYQTYPDGYRVVLSGTCGGLAASMGEVKWRYFDPKKAPRLKAQKSWAENGAYCSEKLPWVSRSWKTPKTKLGGFEYLSKQFYNNIYDVLTNKAKLIVTPQQVRRQIFALQEAHRQNPLPKLKK